MLAWMDLEMTGLDAARHRIIEIATLVTDDDLRITAEGPDLVVHTSDAELAEMDDVVRSMHTGSGLLEAVSASTLTLEDAGQQTISFLRAHLPGPGLVPLAGNSIGTDRRFLAAQLPEVERWFHYRSVDVSSVKELCRRWYPDALRAAPGKHSTHRALDDIRESVSELTYYRANVFRAPAGTNPDHEPLQTPGPLPRPEPSPP